MTEAMDDSISAPNGKVKVTQPELSNPKLRTHLHEYGRRNRTDGPYADNLEVDALIVGGGFAGVFMFYQLKTQLGLNTVLYEAGTDLGGTWRWNCYRRSIIVTPSTANRSQLEPWWTQRFRNIN